MAHCSGYIDSGKECRKSAQKGSAFCKSCNERNATKPGEEAPDRRGFARVSYFPPEVADRARRLLHQEDVRDLTAEIAMVQTILTRYAAAIDAGEPVDTWENFREQFSIMKATHKYVTRPDEFPHEYNRYKLAFAAANQLIRRAVDNRAAEREIVRLTEKLAKLQDTQVKIDSAMGRFVPADKLESLFNALLLAIHESVPDTQPQIKSNLARIIRAAFAKPDLLPNQQNKRMIQSISARFPDAQGPVIDVTPKTRGVAARRAELTPEEVFEHVGETPVFIDPLVSGHNVHMTRFEEDENGPKETAAATDAINAAPVPAPLQELWNKA